MKPDGAWLEVKAYFETSKNNQCVAFEFKTHDLDLDEMTATFIDSDFCTENESELVSFVCPTFWPYYTYSVYRMQIGYMFNILVVSCGVLYIGYGKFLKDKSLLNHISDLHCTIRITIPR